jgi:hypothetical protein
VGGVAAEGDVGKLTFGGHRRGEGRHGRRSKYGKLYSIDARVPAV